MGQSAIVIPTNVCSAAFLREKRQPGKVRTALPPAIWNRKAGGEKYPLSLKDMCTIELLGQLIEAGIDSFKIEGRMKSPEYAAGTTGIYRKYIDRYYENPQNFYVEKHDIEKLKALYIRGKSVKGIIISTTGKI